MNRRKRLLWQLFPSYLLITLISLLAASWYASEAMRQFFLVQTATDLKTRAALLDKQIKEMLSPLRSEAIDAICKEAGQLSATRITVILPDGTVIGDSRETPRLMDNHANRPEIITALGGCIIALLAAGISWVISRRISRPIEQMKKSAEQFAGDDLRHRLTSPATEEMAGLADAINQMAVQLDNRIETIISQRNQLETVLASMLEGVIAVANVSHEIKTPLTAIKGFVETLQQGKVEKIDEKERFLEIIQKHVDRLNAIIEDLLALSRIEQEDESKEINRAKVNLAELFHAAIQICRPKAEEKRIHIDLDCEKDTTAIFDPALIEQAVVNLLDNALKYSEPQSTVLVKSHQQNSEVIISVQDHGIGIAQKHLPRLFERFYRVDKARSRNMGGTGLGLAIVKHIAQAHGGYVKVESKLGEGSRFSIHLPN
jgi:signal transduction histidine kinase